MKIKPSLTSDDLETGAVLMVDKPAGWTSFDVVAKLRGTLRKTLDVKKHKVGHAGTLDPLATGLLIICTGRKTKEIHTFQDMAKEYTGVITLGGTTPSFDLEMPVDRVFPVDHIRPEDMERARQELTGEILQKVPIYSAVRVEGRRMYDMARKGEDVRVKSRMVSVYDFEIDPAGFPEVSFRITTSKGTYIRAIADEFGRLTGSGAHLSELRRTKIGPYSVDDAWDLADLVDTIREIGPTE